MFKFLFSKFQKVKCARLKLTYGSESRKVVLGLLLLVNLILQPGEEDQQTQLVDTETVVSPETAPSPAIISLFPFTRDSSRYHIIALL